MKKLSSPAILGAALAVAAVFPTVVFADEPTQVATERGQNYVSAGLQVGQIRRDENNRISFDALRFKAGREIGTDIDPEGNLAGLIAIEAHIAIGTNLTNSEKFEIRDYGNGPVLVETEADMDWLYGLYVRGNAPIISGLVAYGLLGIGAVDASVKAGSQTETVDKSGLSYGVGVEYDVNETLTIGVDYVGFRLGSKADAGTMNAGVSYRF
jgi:opacity protein-like surface antigen